MASRYWPNVSQPHGMPWCRAVPGMSSTDSMSSTSSFSVPGRTGAKPTPQLPITTVVTPCQHDGRDLLVPAHLAVEVGVDVDEAGREQGAVGVDRAAGLAVDVADAR